MSGIKLVTLIIMASTALIWALWDIIPAVNKIPGDTISELFRIGARNSLLVSCAMGVLAGHFFFPNHHPFNFPGYVVTLVLIGLGLFWLSFDIYHWINLKNAAYHQFVVIALLREYPIINVLIHVLVGYFFWCWKDSTL